MNDMSFEPFKSEIEELLESNLEAAIRVLNMSEIVADVYGVSLCQSGDFFEGIYLMANTVENLEHMLTDEPPSERSYFELHVAEWGWDEFESFYPTRDYLKQHQKSLMERRAPPPSLC